MMVTKELATPNQLEDGLLHTLGYCRSDRLRALANLSQRTTLKQPESLSGMVARDALQISRSVLRSASAGRYPGISFQARTCSLPTNSISGCQWTYMYE